jgi:hypothetical protein
LEDRNLLSFLPAVRYPIDQGSYLADVAVGEVRTGTGLLDIVATDVAKNQIVVLPGNGDGTFQAGHAFPAGFEPYGLALGDFDGDGTLDVVVANPLTNQVNVLLGNGDGTFQPFQSYPAGPGPFAIAVADVNGDGIPDLIAVNASSTDGTISVLLGNGDGSFQAPLTFDTGGPNPYASSVAIGDFNGDGALDLATTNFADSTVSVLLGNGDGTFRPPRIYGTGGFGPTSVVAGDFDGDGRTDLVVNNSAGPVGSVSFLKGNGDGTFRPLISVPAGAAPFDLAAADFNGDGKLDVAATNFTLDAESSGVSVLLGTGQGGFQQPLHYDAAGGNLALAAADFNGDGFPDLVAVYSSSLAVLVNAADWASPGTNQARGDFRLADIGELGRAPQAAPNPMAANTPIELTPSPTHGTNGVDGSSCWRLGPAAAIDAAEPLAHRPAPYWLADDLEQAILPEDTFRNPASVAGLR